MPRGGARPFFWRGREMATKGGRKTCEGCKRWKDVRDKMRIAELLAQAADNFSTVKNGEFKPSLAEYLKLVQLEKEFEEEEVREIKVKWVEPSVRKKSK
jgi:hypothetical protein